MTTPPFVNILDFGAVGDGITLSTSALQAALDAAEKRGGGTVYFPPGKYLTGTLQLHSNLTLYLDAGAVLFGSQSTGDYPVLDGRWEGLNQKTHAPLISGHNLTNIAITGRGTIDGQGAFWWNLLRQNRLAYPRPQLIRLIHCSNILVEGVTLTNSPSWTFNPVRSENITVDKVTIINPPDSPNTDGINPDSCSHVHISNCTISVGDDCITIKSGKEGDGKEALVPCENITITNCTMAHGHGGVVIGSEMSGGVRRVVISNCVFVGTDRGIRMKSRRGRGGVVEDIRVSNIIMEDVLCPITMNLYYACGAWGNKENADRRPRPVSASTPRFRNIHISGITARGVKSAAGFFAGLAEMPLENITLSDMDISLSPDSEASYPEMADDLEKMKQVGLLFENARGLTLERVQINGQAGSGILLSGAHHVRIRNCSTASPYLPFISLVNSSDVHVEAFQLPQGNQSLSTT